MQVSFTALPSAQRVVQQVSKTAIREPNLRELLEQSRQEWHEIWQTRVSNVEKLSRIPLVGKMLTHFYCAGTAFKDLFTLYPTKADKAIRRRNLL